MSKKINYKKFNIADTIYFAINKEVVLDLGAHGPELDITKTSGNIEIQFTTYQTHSENVYFNISIYDYNEKTTTDAGYIYIKHNNGMIDNDAIQVLYKAIQAANRISSDIFNKLY